ncbi:MAG: hypothetical protein ACI9ZT_000518 [Gammaproteobacteria bacterium]|jgi:hypothetical protein
MVNKSEDRKQEDQDLEDYLQGDSALTAAYHAEEKILPAADIDKAILSAANAAIRSKQTSDIAYSPFARTWYVPASMAAVLMLSVGLVFSIYQNSGQTLLTAPKSEYDFEAQMTPRPMANKPAESEESRVAGKKNRQLESAEEDFDEAVMSMDVISEINNDTPASIQVYEKKKFEVQQKPASKIISREKAIEMDDVLSPEIAPATIEETVLKKDALKQTMSDSIQMPQRTPGRLEAADVKQQKRLDANDLNNKLGGMEMEAIEQESGASSAQKFSGRRELDGLLKQNGSLKEESLKSELLGDDIAADTYSRSGKLSDNEVKPPEQWLKQINDLWVLGDQQAVKENLNQFFVVYPDYPIEKVKALLDPQFNLMEYIR